jgi:hypothetical protein
MDFASIIYISGDDSGPQRAGCTLFYLMTIADREREREREKERERCVCVCLI